MQVPNGAEQHITEGRGQVLTVATTARMKTSQTMHYFWGKTEMGFTTWKALGLVSNEGDHSHTLHLQSSRLGLDAT